MFTIELNMFYTAAIAVLVLLLGSFVKKRVHILERFCIPVPVVGGIIFTTMTLLGYITETFMIKFDFVLSDFFMLIFYTSIGFTASIPLLKKAGKAAIVFLILSSLLVILQNVWGIVGSLIIGVDPLVGVATASIPMTGGHGTSAAFAPDLVKLGLETATTITLSAATFGLVAGALIGGPVGKFLIEKKSKTKSASEEENIIDFESTMENVITAKGFRESAYLMLISIGLGTILSKLLSLSGLNFPASVGGMLASAAILNLNNDENRFHVHHSELELMGEIALSIFLAMSMMKLKLWELAELATPMLVLLFGQVILMVLFGVFLTFKFMGGDYDACIITAGHCGFGLGAVPTAMANMNTLSEKYGYSPKAFFLVPLIGSLFINVINSFVITIAMNIAANL
ncbi:sodium/glutamate symporter [Peptoniphilus sp. AGMB00490]|uniref:Sodium/glutamate symporter n=1 Tax=Peptoniphilus faecalis TaxID=2731255 RepID=A0A848RG79_9FIRM|nr:sodium/glutamate symporter [Peptoniphilus faecalis]NMW84403.1 sodium/glutamate symporter [Peptoniphilus faecalis]